MAERARGKSRGKKSGLKGTVATLPKGTKARASRKAKPGSNEHAVPDDLILSHMGKVDRTARDMDKAKEAYDQAKGVHQSAFKSAKEAGVPIDALKAARKLMKRDAGKVVQEFAMVGRILTLAKHDLGADQLDLFGGISATTLAAVDAKQQGLMAGRNGEPAENNTHKPGTKEFTDYAEGWAAGQAENGEKFKQRSSGSTLN